MAKQHKPIEAEIVERPTLENGRCWKVVEAATGAVHFLRGMNAPMRGSVGQKGTLLYTVAPDYSWGLHFWTPEAALKRKGE